MVSLGRRKSKAKDAAPPKSKGTSDSDKTKASIGLGKKRANKVAAIADISLPVSEIVAEPVAISPPGSAEKKMSKTGSFFKRKKNEAGRMIGTIPKVNKQPSLLQMDPALAHIKEMLAALDKAAVLVKLLDKRSTCCWWLVVFYVLAFGAATVEQRRIWELENQPDSTCDGLKQIVFLLSCLSIFFVFRKHTLFNKQQKLMGTVPQNTNIWTGGNGRLLMFELIFNLVHCPPFYTKEILYQVGTNKDIQAFYTMDALMTIPICLRAYHIIELIYVKIYSADAKLKLKEKVGNTFALGPDFVAKAVLHKAPFFFVTMVGCFVCGILAYCSWVFERAYCAPWIEQYDMEEEIVLRCSTQNIDRSANYGDAYWLMMNMMTTLGASLPPLTIMARVISTGGLCMGICLLGLLLQATINATAFTTYERQVFMAMKKQRHEQKRVSTAGALIWASWRKYDAFNVEKRGGCCSRVRRKQARAMDGYCRALTDFRLVMSVDKQRAALKRSQNGAIDMGGNDVRGLGGIDSLHKRMDEMEEKMSARIDSRMDQLQAALLLAVGGKPSAKRAAEMAAMANATCQAEIMKMDAALLLNTAGANSYGDHVGELGSTIPAVLSPVPQTTTPTSSEDGNAAGGGKKVSMVEGGAEAPEVVFAGLVRAVFTAHKPAKAHTVDALLVKYKGKENDLVQKLRSKFDIGSDELPNYPPPGANSKKKKKASDFDSDLDSGSDDSDGEKTRSRSASQVERSARHTSTQALKGMDLDDEELALAESALRGESSSKKPNKKKGKEKKEKNKKKNKKKKGRETSDEDSEEDSDGNDSDDSHVPKTRSARSEQQSESESDDHSDSDSD
jgi:hypothetical protein